MSKACIFPHYFDQNYIPYYVTVYLKELQNYFDTIVLVTNQRTIENRLEIESNKITVLVVKNEGYDFGMFYKGYQFLKKQNHQNYDTIACINDSNILFGSLKNVFGWAHDQKVDFWGLMDANIRPSFSNHQNNYHIQSHFIVFQKKAVFYLDSYFEQLEIEDIFKINDPKTVKMRVINDWEIGVSQYLISKGLKCTAYFNVEKLEERGITIEKSKKNTINTSLDLYAKVIKSGLPILKKRIITSVKPKHIFTFNHSWKRLIKNHAESSINIKSLIKDLSGIRTRHFLKKIFK
jgi:lipopolysaccharide biosynthesis protein